MFTLLLTIYIYGKTSCISCLLDNPLVDKLLLLFKAACALLPGLCLSASQALLRQIGSSTLNPIKTGKFKGTCVQVKAFSDDHPRTKRIAFAVRPVCMRMLLALTLCWAALLAENTLFRSGLHILPLCVYILNGLLLSPYCLFFSHVYSHDSLLAGPLGACGSKPAIAKTCCIKCPIQTSLLILGVLVSNRSHFSSSVPVMLDPHYLATITRHRLSFCPTLTEADRPNAECHQCNWDQLGSKKPSQFHTDQRG